MMATRPSRVTTTLRLPCHRQPRFPTAFPCTQLPCCPALRPHRATHRSISLAMASILRITTIRTHPPPDLPDRPHRIETIMRNARTRSNAHLHPLRLFLTIRTTHLRIATPRRNCLSSSSRHRHCRRAQLPIGITHRSSTSTSAHGTTSSPPRLHRRHPIQHIRMLAHVRPSTLITGSPRTRVRRAARARAATRSPPSPPIRPIRSLWLPLLRFLRSTQFRRHPSSARLPRRIWPVALPTPRPPTIPAPSLPARETKRRLNRSAMTLVQPHCRHIRWHMPRSPCLPMLEASIRIPMHHRARRLALPRAPRNLDTSLSLITTPTSLIRKIS